ncbi:MAG: hypothetical protein ABR575_00890 [Actinomycetota bacterium]
MPAAAGRLAWVLLLLAACGGDGAADIVQETASKLGEIRSGILDLRVAAQGDATPGVGFELRGPFQLPDNDTELPVADLSYVQFQDDETIERRFIGTGDAAYVEVDDQAYELSADQIAGLTGPPSGEGGAGVFDELDIGGWLVEPRVGEPENEDGDEVRRVTGTLDVVAAMNDLFSVARQLGAPTDAFVPLEGEDAEQLRDAVDSSRMEVVTGDEDRLLRHVEIEVSFGLDDAEMRELLGPLGGTTFTFEMSIEDPNEPVEVVPPDAPLPYTELIPQA